MRKEVMDGLFIVTIAALALFGFVAYLQHSPFFKDAMISIAVVCLIYLVKDRFLLSIEGTVLAAAAWLINAAGAFGAYDLYWHGIGWDKLLHVTATTAFAILAFAYLRKNTGMSALQAAVITLLMVEGVGALNEIAEFIGTQYFGVTQGLFGMSNGRVLHMSTFDIFDTQWDMIANTVGASIGILYSAIGEAFATPAATRSKSRARAKSPV